MPCRHLASALTWQPACSALKPLLKRLLVPRCSTCLLAAALCCQQADAQKKLLMKL